MLASSKRECIRLHTGAALAAYVLEFEIPYMMNERLVTEKYFSGQSQISLLAADARNNNPRVDWAGAQGGACGCHPDAIGR